MHIGQVFILHKRYLILDLGRKNLKMKGRKTTINLNLHCEFIIKRVVDSTIYYFNKTFKFKFKFYCAIYNFKL